MKKRHYIFISILIIMIASICFLFITRKTVEAPVSTHGAIDTTDLIHVTYPKPGDFVSGSSIVLTGEARGNWYFEASFPIVVVDWDGRIIGQGHAEAQSDWMTTNYVPFKATLNFVKPEINDSNRSYASRGAIIFKNDNPSGDPAKDAALEVPIVFK